MPTGQDSYGLGYSALYDHIYPEPDYHPDFIRATLERQGPINTALDLGCGTGRHAVGLPYKITGVDKSTYMLAIAKEKMPQHTWLNNTVADFDLGEQFDGAYMLSDIISYHHTNAAVIHAFHNIAHHLKSGATLLFDCWHAPAVLGQQSQTTLKQVMGTARRATNVIDYVNNICQVRYDFFRGSETWHEDHPMRYFSVPELVLYLQLAGFRLESATNKAGQSPGPSDWHVVVMATKSY